MGSNAREVAKNLQKMAHEIAMKRLKNAVAKACYMVHADVVRNTPVNTNILRSSEAVDVKQKKNAVIGIVGTNVKYAPFVEFGTGVYAKNGHGRQTPWTYYADAGRYHGFYRTKGQKPKLMFTNAFEKNKEKIYQIVEEAMRNLW